MACPIPKPKKRPSLRAIAKAPIGVRHWLLWQESALAAERQRASRASDSWDRAFRGLEETTKKLLEDKRRLEWLVGEKNRGLKSGTHDLSCLALRAYGSCNCHREGEVRALALTVADAPPTCEHEFTGPPGAYPGQASRCLKCERVVRRPDDAPKGT